MQAKCINSNDRDRWNAFIANEPFFALMQSWEWGGFKEKLGWKVFRVVVEVHGQIAAGAQMLVKSLPYNLMSVAYIPRGPVGNWLDEKNADCLFSELHRIARQHHAIFLKIEPPLMPAPTVGDLIEQHHFRPSLAVNQPGTTIVLDITSNQEELLMQMRKKTRQYIRRASKEGISVRVGGEQDLPAFYELMCTTGRREKFSARSWDYYENEWQTLSKNDHYVLLLAYYEDQLIAARTACYFGAHAAEFHAGSVDDLTNLHPNYLLVWVAINWAKERGCKTYDFWGIPDDVNLLIADENASLLSDRTDGLWGVYRFKSGFSQNIVSYIGAYDYVYSQIPYALIINNFFRGDALEKISIWMDSHVRFSHSGSNYVITDH